MKRNEVDDNDNATDGGDDSNDDNNDDINDDDDGERNCANEETNVEA